VKISGFSFVRNAVKLYYPVEESIRSVLPICDEFIIAVGKGDDDTREVIEKIGDSKIRIIDTNWDDVDTVRELILSNQTNVALKECTGDWCFYVQADEVVHEDDLPMIQSRCRELFDDRRVEGLIFNYLHFWGDYNHYHKSHGWYPREIRVVRNGIGAVSVRDAQSFRLSNGEKLTVASSNARIFHYGCVRPPYLMQNKQKSFSSVYIGKKAAEKKFKGLADEFDYGPLNLLPVFKKTHPLVMESRISRFDWNDKLRNSNQPGMVQLRTPHKHERIKNRILTTIEQTTGLDFNHKNWKKRLKV
jgi:glycosyltransferase involved in cell wall biosynthesis